MIVPEPIKIDFGIGFLLIKYAVNERVEDLEAIVEELGVIALRWQAHSEWHFGWQIAHIVSKLHVLSPIFIASFCSANIQIEMGKLEKQIGKVLLERVQHRELEVL